jgi:HEAT repeats
MDGIIRSIAGGFRRDVFPASLVFCLSIVPGAAVAAGIGKDIPAAAASGPALQATVKAGRLTLETEGAPLAWVLRAIGEAGSFRVMLRGEFAEPVNHSFIDEPLENTIRRLVEGHSVVILHDDPDPATGIADVAEIRVIENPARAASEPADTESKAVDPQMSYSEPDVAPEEDAIDPVAKEEEYRQAVFDYTPPTKDELLSELDEADPAARVVAIPKVGALRPEEAIGVISHVFSSEEDATVRSRAVAALTRLDGTGSRGLLRERALEDEDPGVRMQALNALASSRGDRAINVLAQALRQDPEPRVRMNAIRALGRIGGDWARRYLEGAARDLDPEVSLAAEQALADRPED